MDQIRFLKQNRLGHSEMGAWNLFGICDLGFGI
jgi:hypothetical protein